MKFRVLPRGWIWLLCGWLLLRAVTAGAHPILQNPVWIQCSPEMLKVRLYVSLRELNVVQGLPIAVDGAVDMGMAEETAPRHSAYLLEHLDFRADDRPLTGTITGIDPPTRIGKGVEGPDNAHFIYHIEYALEKPPVRITFSQSMVQEFPSAPGVPWDFSYAYRFGPPGATPKDFGALPRGTTVTFATGFSPAPGSPADPVLKEQEAAGLRFTMTRLAMLGLALGLGAGSRKSFGVLAGVMTVAFLTGWVLAAGLGWRMPAFLAAALAGIGIMLVAVDNIHRPCGTLIPRRWLMLLFFPVAAGAAVAGLEGPPGFSAGRTVLLGLTALLGGGLLGGGAGLAGSGAPVEGGEPVRRAWLPLISLAVCAGGLMVLFDGLGIRPWSYWVERLTG